MMRWRRKSFPGWLGRRAFAMVVAVIAVASAWVAVVTSVPQELPSYALQAVSVYRVEVGGAFFAAVYLVATAIALAAHNRAFTELGSSGISARDLTAEKEDESVEWAESNLKLIRDALVETKNRDDDK
jgi:hypothetical protein